MCSRPTGPRAFLGGDLEHPGIFESFLLSRGSVTKELIFLSVGDTRDHRRQYKDPALRTISTEFLLNLLANLRALDLDHHAILTTPALCAQLQRSHCEYSCAWTSLWHDHPGLAKWSLKPYDMFLMWQQQWRYVARALELGYRVLRTDTDVYFAESPYPILHGPLLSRAAMVVQQDFGGPLGERPSCIKRVHSGSQSCGLHRGTALLNIGLLYVRSTPEGGAFHVINETWSRFVTMLSSEPARPPHLNGQVDPNPLIDQQIMRDVLNDLAVPTEQPESKPRSRWLVVPGSAASVYPPGVSCALDSVPACDAVGAEREKASFLIQYAAPKPYRTGERRVEQVALAPDWFFGRGCLTHVRQPKTLIDRANPGISRQTSCVSPPLTKGKTMLAPGPSAGLLVATHFVYSMALKRKRTFRSFGWDLGDHRPRANYSTGTCWDRSKKGILFGHTFFSQVEDKYVLCAMPSDDQPACACCAGLPATEGTKSALQMETTSGRTMFNSQQLTTLAGCADYQMFWDRR